MARNLDHNRLIDLFPEVSVTTHKCYSEKPKPIVLPSTAINICLSK